jgi:hypothetical protein
MAVIIYYDFYLFHCDVRMQKYGKKKILYFCEAGVIRKS